MTDPANSTAPHPTQADAPGEALDLDALEKLARAAASVVRPELFEPIVRDTADAIYERIMLSVQDYLRENAEWNLAGELRQRDSTIRSLEAERREMQAEIERGREALRPFAEAARWPIGATEITPQHVVHCDVIRTGYPPLKVGSFGLKAADFVLALTTYEAARAPVAVSPAGQQDAVREAVADVLSTATFQDGKCMSYDAENFVWSLERLHNATTPLTAKEPAA